MNRVEWEAEIKKQLALRKITLKDMANDLGLSYGYIRRVVADEKTTEYQSAINRVSEYLGVYPYKVQDND